jgi:hypothetical protein
VDKPVVNVTVSSSRRFKPSGGFLLSRHTPHRYMDFTQNLFREQKYLKGKRKNLGKSEE